MVPAFEQFLKSKINISEEEIAYVSTFLQPKKFKANTQILRQGEIEKYLSFIEKGVSRYYSVGENGKETSILFTFENWFLGEVTSFLTQSPSSCFIEALTETKVWRINYEDLQKIYAQTKEGNKFGRLMMEELYIRKAMREKSFLEQTAEKRYLELLHHSPKLLQHLKLKHLASYLGITPQALSRIRGRI